jgi:hypothetical protein
MKEQNEVTKVEFLITLNENFVVQRFFNVKDYNPRVKKSVDLHDMMTDISNGIKNLLRNKTVDYMLENRYAIETDPMVLETSNTDGPELFNIFLKIGNEIIYHRIIDAKLYPPKVRYTLDTRPQLKSILKSLTEIMSEKNLTHNYLNYNLV